MVLGEFSKGVDFGTIWYLVTFFEVFSGFVVGFEEILGKTIINNSSRKLIKKKTRI